MSAIVHHAIRLHVAVFAALSATMAQPEVTAHLSVDASPSGVVATLTFTNTSASTVLLEPFNALAAGPLDADVFRITGDSDSAVRYKGMMVKRGRPSASEYVNLESGKPLHTAAVDLTPAYDFPAGTHAYKAQYIARVTYPDRDGFWTLKSNVVAFTYTK
jgi:hypothetical protein